MIKIPKIEEVEVTELKTDKQNPNVMEKKQIEALKKNITEFGFLVPIITNKDLVIADGEHRLKAAIELGMKTVPVIKLNVSDIDRRILRQVMNKLKGEHEKTGDIAEFMRIYEAGEIERMKELLALDNKEMSKIMDSLKVITEDEAPPVPETTDIKLGDVFTLGNHRLMCGDSTNEKDVLKLMGNERADMVFTDPPYNLGYKYNDYRDNKPLVDYQRWCGEWLKILESCCKGPILITTGTRNLMMWEKIKHPDWVACWLKRNSHTGSSLGAGINGWEPIIIYNKQKTRINLDVYDFLIEKQFLDETDLGDLHPCPKPLKLVAKLIEDFCLNDKIVLDLFGGSGTTLIACEQLQRACRMMEIDPLYCQVIINRWEAFTKLKAVKI